MADFNRLHALNHDLACPVHPISRSYPWGPDALRPSADEELDADFLAGAINVLGDFRVYERDDDDHVFGVMVTRLFDPR